jgi:allantoicase
VHGIVIDTAWFTGNFPPEASIEAASLAGYPSTADVAGDARWTTIVPRSAIKADCENSFPVSSPHRWTHIRLSIYPDGGVARLRVHGEAVPDPWLLDLGCPDLAALENGGRVVGCSDMFYGSPGNMISPGRATVMSDGWETARRRGGGNDWVTVQLAAAGAVRLAELDTSYFRHNAPASAQLRGCQVSAGETPGEAGWFPLLELTALQPDTRHRFLIDDFLTGDAPPATHVRLDIYPDGGMARLRLFGIPSAAGRRAAGLRWFNALPPHTARDLASGPGELPPAEAERLVAARPLRDSSTLPPGLRRLTDGAVP